MRTAPVTADRSVLVDDLEGLPGSAAGCVLALTLASAVWIRAGDVWWVEDDVLHVRRGQRPPVAHAGCLEWRRKW
ncbi:hypothetical protein [Micromonospora psammae]|uniref:hypothetical protein n=1 Tax=Micromonospora sp. CPCC 205556 TaxID=3122398 RepID=UPI002FF0353F